jgi:hypothetical protein
VLCPDGGRSLFRSDVVLPHLVSTSFVRLVVVMGHGIVRDVVVVAAFVVVDTGCAGDGVALLVMLLGLLLLLLLMLLLLLLLWMMVAW